MNDDETSTANSLNCVPNTNSYPYGHQGYCTCHSETTETTVETIEYGADDKIVKRVITKTTTTTPYRCNAHYTTPWYGTFAAGTTGTATTTFSS